MEEAILKLENLSHVYSVGTPFELTAVHDINVSIARGEVIGIIGHTGSGKSTLIQHMNGLIKPTGGRVLFDGEDIHASKENVRKVRSKVGLVFQYPEYQLFEETVYKDIAFGPKNMKLSEKEIDEHVKAAARFVGLDEELFQKSPFELSGGQKRRVAIAGVIAMMPDVLILDEPMAGLDPVGRGEIMKNILSYHAETGAAIVIVTHSMEDAAEFAQRMIVMNHGTVSMDGTPEEVFSRGEELKGMGLSVPMMTELKAALERRGVSIPGTIYTEQQMKQALLKLRGGALNA